MKIRKVYALRGLLTLRLSFHESTGLKPVEFSGGIEQGDYLYGGFYSTVNPKEQAAIEATARFKKGQIYIKDSFEVKDEIQTEEKPSEPKLKSNQIKSNQKTHTEVINEI